MVAFRATAFFVICSVLSFFLYGSVASVLAPDVHFCEPQQTECRYGCCPFANATCCSDGLQCCESGAICLPGRQLCVRSRNPNGGVASSRVTPVTLPASEDKNDLACPPGTTPCARNKCCLFRYGTCCIDGLHCCPFNYRCDVSRRRCYRNVNNELTSNLNDDYNGTAVTKPFRTLSKWPYDICPSGGGGIRHCPEYTSCCQDGDMGFWMCCLDLFKLKSHQDRTDDDNDDEDDSVTETVWE